MKAVFIEQQGGPEVIRYGDFPKPEPGQGQVLVKVAYSGVNYIDIYHRVGIYKLPFPAVLGTEGAGTVEGLGEGVTGFKIGDRVAWTMSRGSYAEYAAVPANVLIKIPEGVESKDAAAALLQGMTAHYLTHSTFPIYSGMTALVHAAAGGTGRLISQMIKMRGGRVIATAGSSEKAQIAREAGADEVILYKDQDFTAEVKRLTNGVGVDVVYDGVGQATFMKSLDSLRPRGMMVSFGNASGPVQPVEPGILLTKGSLFLTRPSLVNYSSPQELEWRAGDVFAWINEGRLKLIIDHIYPLSEAAQAQRDLESRKTIGKLVLAI